MGEAARRTALGMAPRQIQITPEMMQHAKFKQCECGGKYFIPAVSVFTISELVSPIGRELTGQQPALLCAECMKPLP
jgi:hypothetical protein